VLGAELHARLLVLPIRDHARLGKAMPVMEKFAREVYAIKWVVARPSPPQPSQVLTTPAAMLESISISTDQRASPLE
jgi:hypothetical protein